MENENVNIKKLRIFSQLNTKLHISLDNGAFYNGFIIKINTDFMLFKDEKFNIIPIFYEQISFFEPFISLSDVSKFIEIK